MATIRTNDPAVFAIAHVILALDGKSCADIETSKDPLAVRARDHAWTILMAYENFRADRRWIAFPRVAGGALGAAFGALAAGVLLAIGFAPIVFMARALW